MSNTHHAIDSLIFLTIARNTIIEMVSKSSVKEKDELESFIRNEASDYEVMHLLTYGEMPSKKYDSLNEAILWESVRKLYQEHSDYLSETIDKDSIHKLVSEIGSVGQYGLSSSKPILEFQTLNGNVSDEHLCMLDESIFNSEDDSVKVINISESDITEFESAHEDKMVYDGGAVIATAVLYGAYKQYTEMKDNGHDLSEAKVSQINTLKESINKAPNSDSCKKIVQAKISKLQKSQKKG